VQLVVVRLALMAHQILSLERPLSTALQVALAADRQAVQAPVKAQTTMADVAVV